MSNLLNQNLASNLEEFRQQSLRIINDANFALNNLQGPNEINKIIN